MESCFFIVEITSEKNIYDSITMSYEERFLRRKKLVSDNGIEFLVNLPETKSLNHHHAFKLENGMLVKIKLKKEPLLEISGKNLMQLVWHIGNRHIPCEIAKNKIFIQYDLVIKEMIEK